MVPWLNIWRTAPLIPCGVKAAMPSITYPMWLMLEYATSFFRSSCAIAHTAP